jgi:hypothetical protein
VQAYADALLVVVKVLAQNSGLDPQESIVKLQEEYTGPKQAVGLDIKTGQYRPKYTHIQVQSKLYYWTSKQVSTDPNIHTINLTNCKR